MLLSLSIRDVILIDRLDLEFGPGLCALTGETGAGKSILLDALGLAIGARADRSLVRAGQAQAIVTAEFDVPSDHQVWRILSTNGLGEGPELDVEAGVVELGDTMHAQVACGSRPLNLHDAVCVGMRARIGVEVTLGSGDGQQ